jgi:hydroxyacylglutathione hydrolase
MIIKRIPTGMFGSNCYIVGLNGEGVIIDPGTSSKEVREIVGSLGITIKYIIITHSHIDHICSVDEVKLFTGAKVAVHEADAVGLADEVLNGSAMFSEAKAFNPADILLKDGDVLEVGGLKLEIIHTPGHSPGGICVKAENNLFTGDTLFKRSIGRTDLGNGNYKDIINSIKSKLLLLDDSTVVYPGHGTYTDIGSERKHNPFLR